MGDVHFIIRHGLTGFVFLVFTAFGLLILLDFTDLVERLTSSSGAGGGDDSILGAATTLVVIFLTTPVIGVVIQGLHVAYIYWQEVAWADPARREVAIRIRTEVARHRLEGLAEDTRKIYPHLLCDVRPDSLFVWFYYSHARDSMIDWARRRRSYYYLGQNWVIAAAVGFLCGLMVAAIGDYFDFVEGRLPTSEKADIVLLVAVVSLLWAGGTLWIAEEMKHDVDDMEFVWALSQLHPEAFSLFLPDNRPPPQGSGGPPAPS